MFPDVTLHNSADVDVVCSVARRDLLQSEVGIRAQPANGPYVGFGEASGAVSASRRTGAVARLVSMVLCDGRPSEIARSVIVTVTVPVRDNVLLRGSRSVESGAYSDMHRDGETLAKRHLQIVALSGLAKGDASIKDAASIAVIHPAVNRADTATARRLIAWVSRYLAPLFSFPSHAAVLQQGAT